MDDEVDDDELANLDMEPPKERQKRNDEGGDDNDDELLMMCGNEDLMRQ